MDERIVARPDWSMILIAAVLAAGLIGTTAPYGNGPMLFVLSLLAFVAVRRLADMKLSVTRSSVIVVNYTSRHELPLDTVRVMDEIRQAEWTADDETEKKGRALYLVDAEGHRVRVGVAPAYGSRLDAIAEDLYRAMAEMRAAG